MTGKVAEVAAFGVLVACLALLVALLACGPSARERCEASGGRYVTVECHDEDTQQLVGFDGNNIPIYMWTTDTVCTHRCEVKR